MKEIIQALLEKRELLKSGDSTAALWAEKEKLFYAFNTSGDLLAAGVGQIALTTDGRLSSDTYWDGREKDFLTGKRQERAVLYFIPSGVSLEQYKERPFLISSELPMPEGFLTEAVECQEDIFTIRSHSDASISNSISISGAFYVIHLILSMIESLYLVHGVSEEILRQCYYEFLPEEHQSFLAKQEQDKKRLQKKAALKQSCQVRAEDFSSEDSEYIWEGTITLWDMDTELYFSYLEEDFGEDLKETSKNTSKTSETLTLDNMTALLNRHLNWIEENKTLLLYALFDDDMVELACEWMEAYDLIEQNGTTYYDLRNDELFPYPVTRQSFSESLLITGIDASYHGSYGHHQLPNEMLFDIFLDTSPDFFAGHSIEVFLRAGSDGRYQIHVNGLAG